MIEPSELNRAKETIRAGCAAFEHARTEFELLTGSLLREFGFFAVQRQVSGVQFGRDYTADLKETPTASATHSYMVHVAEKLLWHVDSRTITVEWRAADAGITARLG